MIITVIPTFYKGTGHSKINKSKGHIRIAVGNFTRAKVYLKFDKGREQLTRRHLKFDKGKGHFIRLTRTRLHLKFGLGLSAISIWS